MPSSNTLHHIVTAVLPTTDESHHPHGARCPAAGRSPASPPPAHAAGPAVCSRSRPAASPQRALLPGRPGRLPARATGRLAGPPPPRPTPARAAAPCRGREAGAGARRPAAARLRGGGRSGGGGTARGAYVGAGRGAGPGRRCRVLRGAPRGSPRGGGVTDGPSGGTLPCQSPGAGVAEAGGEAGQEEEEEEGCLLQASALRCTRTCPPAKPGWASAGKKPRVGLLRGSFLNNPAAVRIVLYPL